MRKITTVIFCLCLLASALLPLASQAWEWGPFSGGWQSGQSGMRSTIINEGLTPFGQEAYQTEGTQHIRFMAMVGFIIRMLLYFMAIFFLVLIIYGGATWMTAGGNEEKVTKAKKIILNSILGVIIIFSAFAITVFIARASVGAMYARQAGFSFPGMGGW